MGKNSAKQSPHSRTVAPSKPQEPAEWPERIERLSLSLSDEADVSSAVWRSYVHEWKVAPDPQKRKAVAKSLMAYAGASMRAGRPVDQAVVTWLGERLHEAALTGDADHAFALKAGSGKRANPVEQLRAAMEVHVAMQWLPTRAISNAATAVAALPGRVSAANLTKHYKAMLQHWDIAGPFVLDDQDRPILGELAGQMDLRNGTRLGVEFRAKLEPTNFYLRYVTLDLKDL